MGTYIDIPAIHLTGSSAFWGLKTQTKFNSFMRNFNSQGLVYDAIGGLSSHIANSVNGFIRKTNETFYSFSGGTNDPDPYTLDKLRGRDKIESNNMFEYILNGYARAFKYANVKPDQFQTAIDMMSLSSLPRGNGCYSIKDLAVKSKSEKAAMNLHFRKDYFTGSIVYGKNHNLPFVDSINIDSLRGPYFYGTEYIIFKKEAKPMGTFRYKRNSDFRKALSSSQPYGIHYTYDMSGNIIGKDKYMIINDTLYNTKIAL